MSQSLALVVSSCDIRRKSSLAACLSTRSKVFSFQLEKVVVRSGPESLRQLVPDCHVQCCKVFYLMCGDVSGCGGWVRVSWSGVVGGSIWCGRGFRVCVYVYVCMCVCVYSLCVCKEQDQS